MLTLRFKAQGKKARDIAVPSFRYAAQWCNAEIARNDYGSRDIDKMDVLENGRRIGFVSYNGRCWDLNQKEIEI